MKKLFSILLLIAGMTFGAFAQTPAEPPVEGETTTSTAPQLSTEQKLEITSLMLRYQTLASQVNNLNQQIADDQKKMTGLQTQYKTLTTDLCKSTDGVKYIVDVGNPADGTGPSCQVEKTPATPSPDKK